MAKNYIYITLIILLGFAKTGFAQETKANKLQEIGIDGLTMYPNPVTNGKVYINSKSGFDKEISIFNVLGKMVYQTQLSSKELNVNILEAGAYIIKIKENDATATRKLIIR